MNLTDDQIRAALEHVASRAPDPARVRAHLSARARQHRQRRVLLMAGGAAGVAVAIGVPAAILSRRRPPSRPASPSLPDERTRPNLTPPAPEPAPGPGNGRVPLLYRPTYLPDDFVEVFRTVSIGAETYQARAWHLDHGPTETPGEITLDVASDGGLHIDDRSREITVNGAPGWLTPPDAEVQQVVWSTEPGLSVSVEARHVDDGWAVVQEVARSVERNTVSGLEVPTTFGYLPPDRTGERWMTVEPDGDQWVATQWVLQDRAGVLEARLGANLTFAPGSPQTELRGRLGYVRVDPGGGGGTAFVTLESGLNLQVSVPGGSGPITAEELVRVTNEMTVGSAPYVGWIWHR